MKPKNSLIRLKQFQVTAKHRQVGQLETMIAEFERMSNELDAQIKMEEEKARITDVNHFAYPTFAKAARTRRDNLIGSIRDLQSQLETAREEMMDAEAELQKAERLEVRETGREEEKTVSDYDRAAMIG